MVIPVPVPVPVPVPQQQTPITTDAVFFLVALIVFVVVSMFVILSLTKKFLDAITMFSKEEESSETRHLA